MGGITIADNYGRQLRSNPYTPLKQALRMKLLCALGRQVGCSWANASTIRQLSKSNRYFDYIFSDTDVLSVESSECLSEDIVKWFSVWESDSITQVCKVEYDFAPQCVKNLFKDSNALKEYANEIAYFYSFVNRKHIESVAKTLGSIQAAFPCVVLDTFLEISSFLNYLLRPEDDDVLHAFRLKFTREADALCILAILAQQSFFSGDGKNIEESMAEWLAAKSDYSMSTLFHISAVMECPIEKIEFLLKPSSPDALSL